MPGFRMALTLGSALPMLCLAAGLASAAPASVTETQRYAFTGGSDGAYPSTPLIGDGLGNLYGMAENGGQFCSDDSVIGCGTIFKLDGSGHLSTLLAFRGEAAGAFPRTGLILLRGTLFGTAQVGSNNSGIVFSIGTDGSHYTVLHQFDGFYGQAPAGVLQRGPFGGLWGVTSNGGPTYSSDSGRGVLFYVQPDGAFKVAHDFFGSDGLYPSTLIENADGTLFGSTRNGGNACTTVKHGCGVVFEYQPQTKVFTVLHAFAGGADGQTPLLGSVGPDGTIYGATQAGGGLHLHGTLFSLTPGSNGYSYANLASFPPAYPGEGPLSGPSLARNGALFVATTTHLYGYQNGTLKALDAFSHTDGASSYPSSQLLIPAHGSIGYSVSQAGGTSSCTQITGSPYCGNILSFDLQR